MCVHIYSPNLPKHFVSAYIENDRDYRFALVASSLVDREALKLRKKHN
jgi:hypothetical protein